MFITFIAYASTLLDSESKENSVDLVWHNVHKRYMHKEIQWLQQELLSTKALGFVIHSYGHLRLFLKLMMEWLPCFVHETLIRP